MKRPARPPPEHYNLDPIPVNEVEFKAVGDDRLAIFIDGASLIDMLREHELPFVSHDRQPDIAGGYSWLPRTLLLPALSSPRAAAADSELHREGRVALLGCRECGDWDCWRFYVRVTFHDAAVTWHDMTQPHRRKWRYDHFGPFVFPRGAYEAALRAL